jgi:phosphoribosylaminoimidazole-succinocarboxamide synthase
MSDEFVASVSERYIELFENITGDPFLKSDTSEIQSRIEKSVTNFIKSTK